MSEAAAASALAESDATGERVRLFVALDLPEPVRRALLEWRSSQSVIDRLRLTRPDALHATLCFLGWRSAEEIEPIGAAVARSAGGSLDFELALGDALWLPSRRPRVLAVAIEDPSGSLRELQEAISENLSADGWYTPEKRPYLAHVTVGRVPARERVRATELPSSRRLWFSPAAVTLYRSRLERGGARYEPLASVEPSSGGSELR